jgi:nucleotidyltransferase/DNA polymerase involved in DNA repair
MSTILHADMDAFYAAVEARERPEIADDPIVVGADPRDGRGRGVVAACNYHAREFGIHSAMPISEAYRRCPDAVYLPVRMAVYIEVSDRIMAILRGYTDLVEKLSIDEAFLDVTASAGLFGDGVTIARSIKREIRDREGLTVSIGVAPNKFLAKLASAMAKPDGLLEVPAGEQEAFLRPLPVERLWGVGSKTADRLHGSGIVTIGDLAEAAPARLESIIGPAAGARLHLLAHGRDDRPVQPDQERKQISRETTFSSDVGDRTEVLRVLLALTEDVTAMLRRRRIAGHIVTVKLRLAPFETRTRQRTTELSLMTTEAVYPIAVDLLRAADPGDRPVRLVGVGISGLHEPRSVQLSLFERGIAGERDHRISEAIDGIRRRFGKGALRRARLVRRPERRGAD